MWWEVPETMYGIVNHQDDNKKWESKYSKDIKNRIEPTVIIDGLFMVVRKSKISKPFDETVDGFHFYDMNFCVSNFLDNNLFKITSLIAPNIEPLALAFFGSLIDSINVASSTPKSFFNIETKFRLIRPYPIYLIRY